MKTRKIRAIDKARWPDRLPFRVSQNAANALVKQEGSREAAALKAGVSVVTLRRWIIGEDRAPITILKLLKKRTQTRSRGRVSL